jgi:outer membrane protein insertion porin family
MSGLFQTAGSTLGLDMVSIQPVMIAGHEDLRARLTLRKDITPDFSLIFSQTLAHAGDQTWIASYDTIKNLQIRGINMSEDDTLALELDQDLRWGGGPPLPRRVNPKDEEILGKVTFEGSMFPEKELRRKVTREGERFNAYRMNTDVRRLREYFLEQDHPDVRVRAERTSHDGKVDVRFLIEDGPKVTFAFEGAKLSNNLRKELRQIWARFSGEKAELRESQGRILQRLRDDGYLQAKINVRDESTDDKNRHFVFEITQGYKWKKPEWVIKGMEKPPTITESAGTVMARPQVIQQNVETGLRTQGFLDATATEPELILEGKPRFEMSVSPGIRYDVTQIQFDGNQFFDSEKLSQVAVTPPTNGTEGAKAGPPMELPFPLTSDWLETASRHVTSEYWREGFNNVQVVPSVTTDKERAQATVKLDITEGEQQILQKIQFEGADLTHPPFVRRQFAFKEGDPLDISRINLTRKRLYDTRLFRRVDIDTVPIGSANDYMANIRLNEQAPWRFRYGIYAENRRSEDSVQLGGVVETSYSNLFGQGILAGIRLKTDAEEREARLYGSLPIFLGRDVTTTLSVFTLRDTTEQPITLREKGATIEQLWKLKDHYILSYDYTFQRNQSEDPRTKNATDPWINISEFGVTVTRDTRDDILNAKRGTFLSNHFAIAPPALGSTVNYFRNYSQFFRFRPLRSHRNLIWATALKGGFAKEFGRANESTVRNFRIGGGTTGTSTTTDEDELSLEPGTALFVASQDLRFPLFWRFSAVTSFDAGVTYDKFATVKPFQFRYSPGVGIRIMTPVVLVRFDYGRDLWARHGQPDRRWAFGIGQSF